VQSALGLAWVALVAFKAPDFLPWLSPVAAGLILAVPLSVWTSRTHVGLACRNLGLFLTPTELRVPREIAAAEQYAGSGRPLPRFVDAVVDPEVHAQVRLAARRRSPLAADDREMRVQRALAEGPDTLTSLEQLRLLGDLDALDALRRAVTTRSVHPDWTSSRDRGRATIHRLLPHARGEPGTLATLVQQR
jgi:membrane glycosyltransferase